MHFERRISEYIKLCFFPGKKKVIKKIVCLPYLKISDPLPETHLFFIWPNGNFHGFRRVKD